MRIGTKLTLQFTGIVSVILAVVLVSVYYLSAIESRNDFYARLKERALAAADIFLEKDEVTKDRYELFQKKFLQTLPEEVIQVFDEKNLNAFVERNDKISTGKELLDRIRSERYVELSLRERQEVGIYYEDNQGNFVILASAIDTPGSAKLAHLQLILLLSFFGSLAVVYLTGRYFSRRALNPIRDIVREVKEITASNLHLRLSEGSNRDELAELAMTFNDTLRRLDLAFESQRTFVSNASHELRTPLTAMIGELEVLLSRERSKAEYASTLARVLEEAEELKELTNMLLGLAKTTLTDSRDLLEEIRVDELIAQERERVAAKLPGAEVVLSFDALPPDPEGLTVSGSRHLLSSALSNILENAIKFSNRQRVVCSLRCAPGALTLTVADSGIGIAQEDLRNIFQPFFRGENARGFVGHGIGLALAEKIIRLHGGTVGVTSQVNVGTVVRIDLPLAHF